MPPSAEYDHMARQGEERVGKEPVIISSSSDDSGSSDDNSSGSSKGSNDDNSQDESTDSEGDAQAGALLDLEAAETGSESGRTEDSYDSEAYAIDGRDYRPRDNRDFPQFMKLPFELRIRIWEAFCPDLNGARRVIDIAFVQGSDQIMQWYPCESNYLALRTETSRAVLAVHRESRNFALKWFPDSLPIFDPKGVIRFNSKRDIVRFETSDDIDGWGVLPLDQPPELTDLLTKIVNIAIPTTAVSYENDDENEQEGLNRFRLELYFLGNFPNLENVFGVIDNLESLPSSAISWLETDHCDWTQLRVSGVDDRQVFSFWHDPDTPCSREGLCAILEPMGFCGRLSTLDHLVELAAHPPQDEHTSSISSFLASKTVYKWPFIEIEQFNNCIIPDHTPHLEVQKSRPFVPHTSGLSLVDWYDGLPSAGRLGQGTEDDTDEDSEDESPDEYESDGIDDAPIQDPQTEDEDQDGSGIEDDTLAMELLSSTRVPESDDSQAYDTESDVLETGGVAQAARNGFSPLDEDSDSTNTAPKSPQKRRGARRVISDDSDEEEAAGSAAGTMAIVPTGGRGIKRRRIVSDDEDDDDGKVENKEARPHKRRGRIIEESEDESDVQEISARSAGSTQQGVLLVSDSEDERALSRRTAKRSRVVEEDSDEQEDQSEDECEPKTLTLAQRLQIHRQANPVSSASEGDTDNDGEEEEEEEDSGLQYGEGESDEEDSENSLMDGMAEEASEDDDDF